MEVKEKSKKRELIKTIAIIFLLVLLVLTFFSQTIMNRSLPEVATQTASSGTINAKIRGSGTVAANETYEVSIKQTREVRSVCVRVGDKVEVGDLLFVLGDIESQELKSAQEALNNARLSYQRRVLELSKSYAADDQNVKIIREDLEEAYAKRDANYVTDDQISYAKGDLAAAQSVLNQIQFALKELNAQQSDSEEYASAKNKVDDLKAKIKILEETDIPTLEKSIRDNERKLNEGTSSDASTALSDAQKTLSDARAKWNNDYAANYTKYISLLEHVKAYYDQRDETIPSLVADSGISLDAFMRQDSYVRTYLANAKGSDAATGSDGEDDDEAAGMPKAASEGPTTAEIAEESRVYNLLYSDLQAIDTANKAVETAQRAANSANNTAWNEEKAIRDQISAAQSDLRAAQDKLSAYRSDLRVAQAALDAADNANSQLKAEIRQQEANQRQQEALITELESALASLQERQTAYKAALDTISAKERELENALSGKDIDKQLNNLDLQSMSLEIQKYEQQVEKYRQDSVDAEIKAPVAGLISSINVSAGKETTPEAPMAAIDVVDRGYTIKIPVTNEQARNVKVGDTADVTNYYFGNDITATLEQIAPDPASAGQKKLLVFRLTGDIDAGTNISLSIGQRSAPFDTIIPKSALREDSNGKFVFVITSKSTPLGNRYTATRADVQVLGEDDTSVAVSGLSRNDYVITTSSKPLDAGSQVRMVENP